ncbi:MAG: hypothetical protein HY287_06500 [Planctomycetes bacterium]|nr:hypothetical protein [Planctomycetota bacterium]
MSNCVQVACERIRDRVRRGHRAPGIVVAALFLVTAAGCTSSDGAFSNVVGGVSEGISNAAAHLMEALLISLFV